MIGKIVAIVLIPLAGFLGVVSVLVVLIGSLNPFNSSTSDTPAGGPAPGVPGPVADIPADYLTLYTQAAANCPGLDWSILAAIGKIETDHGRSNLPGVHSSQNASGARGPMQFLQPTFDAVTAKHPLPAGGASPPSPYNPSDAVHAAAFLLCDNGARDGRNLSAAIWNYNHDNRYVAQVLEQAHRYAAAAASPPQQPDQAAPPAPGADPSTPAPGTSPAAAAAIAYARQQLGLPYQWGGNGPEAGQAGFDCSGLTHAAYQAAGIALPRTADTQYRSGPVLPTDQGLQPGDLVFYRAPGAPKITHVALFAGNGKVVHAPDRGKLVEEVPLPTRDYVGATRPAKQDLLHQVQRRSGSSMSVSAGRASARPSRVPSGEGPTRDFSVDATMMRPIQQVSGASSPPVAGAGISPSLWGPQPRRMADRWWCHWVRGPPLGREMCRPGGVHGYGFLTVGWGPGWAGGAHTGWYGRAGWEPGFVVDGLPAVGCW
ncbi:hypothetical protein GCM10023321_72680 [Pseudonocardia eucalypti]|uniref:NlpC/P60 domain-containing protein n=1 Tax=Pseudonocardia eucalypti TaxID=648755 RepID=A0ABP9R789_9PSEU|nr:cell wall-associated NlpC family hydrolase [Pseudonocardia eucalypti]